MQKKDEVIIEVRKWIEVEDKQRPEMNIFIRGNPALNAYYKIFEFLFI